MSDVSDAQAYVTSHPGQWVVVPTGPATEGNNIMRWIAAVFAARASGEPLPNPPGGPLDSGQTNDLLDQAVQIFVVDPALAGGLTSIQGSLSVSAMAASENGPPSAPNTTLLVYAPFASATQIKRKAKAKHPIVTPEAIDPATPPVSGPQTPG